MLAFTLFILFSRTRYNTITKYSSSCGRSHLRELLRKVLFVLALVTHTININRAVRRINRDRQNAEIHHEHLYCFTSNPRPRRRIAAAYEGILRRIYSGVAVSAVVTLSLIDEAEGPLQLL